MFAKQNSMLASLTILLVVAALIATAQQQTVSSASSSSSASVIEDSWASKALMQQARGYLGVAVANGKVYAIGGFTIGGLYEPDFGKDGFVGTNEEYDPETDTWVFKKPMPTSRAGYGIAVYQNKIYCIGGRTIDGVTGVNEVYDPETDTWENKTAMPTARYLLNANVVNGRVYLVGGSPNYTLNEVYDPETDAWVTETSMPTGVSGYASTVVYNKIHVMGGDVNYVTSTLHQIYDTENDSWSIGTSIPERVTKGSAGVTTGALAPIRIYFVGFRKLDGEGINYVYDPNNDSWGFGAGVPTSRFGMGVAVVNETLYAVGGYVVQPLWNDVPVAVNEQYIPFGYGTPDPSFDGVAPKITVTSPENKTYYTTDIPLNFSVNEPASWMRYKLDNQTTTEISDNTTLTGLSYGQHNLTVYATDIAGNNGVSETIHFTIAEEPKPEPFPTTLVATAFGASIAVIGVGLLIYFKKRKH